LQWWSKQPKEPDLVRHESLLKYLSEHPNQASPKMKEQQPMMVTQSR
jgi:hypothetical protein